MSTPPPTAAIRVGTASWSEPEFVKAGWYPKGLAAGQRLPVLRAVLRLCGVELLVLRHPCGVHVREVGQGDPGRFLI